MQGQIVFGIDKTHHYCQRLILVGDAGPYLGMVNGSRNEKLPVKAFSLCLGLRVHDLRTNNTRSHHIAADPRHIRRNEVGASLVWLID